MVLVRRRFHRHVHQACLCGSVTEKGVSSRMIRRMVLAVVLLGLLAALSGCNTVQGVGRDITWLGQKGAEVFEEPQQ